MSGELDWIERYGNLRYGYIKKRIFHIQIGMCINVLIIKTTISSQHLKIINLKFYLFLASNATYKRKWIYRDEKVNWT